MCRVKKNVEVLKIHHLEVVLLVDDAENEPSQRGPKSWSVPAWIGTDFFFFSKNKP